MHCRHVQHLSNHQRLALLLSLLVLTEDVTARVHQRPPYESQFEGLFASVGNELESLALLHSVVKDDKRMAQNIGKIVEFAKNNPGGIGVAVGLAASSWLLYNSIALADQIKLFFNDIAELNGKFDEYYLHAVPKLEKMLHEVEGIVDDPFKARQKAFFDELHDNLMKYYKDLENTLDWVNDVLSDTQKAKFDATVNAALSTLVTVIAGFSWFQMDGKGWTKDATLFTAAGAGVSAGLSLKNFADLTKATQLLQDLKVHMRKLRDHVWTKMMIVRKNTALKKVIEVNF